MKADFSWSHADPEQAAGMCRVAGLIWGWWRLVGPVVNDRAGGSGCPGRQNSTLDTWTACFSDHMPQVEPGNGSYTEAARFTII